MGATPQRRAQARLGAHPLRVVPGDDEHLGGDVGADAEGCEQLRCQCGGEFGEVLLVGGDFVVELFPAACDRTQRVFGGRLDGGDGART